MPLGGPFDEVLTVDECATGFFLHLLQHRGAAPPRNTTKEQQVAGIQRIAKHAERSQLSGNQLNHHLQPELFRFPPTRMFNRSLRVSISPEGDSAVNSMRCLRILAFRANPRPLCTRRRSSTILEPKRAGDFAPREFYEARLSRCHTQKVESSMTPTATSWKRATG